MRKPKTLNRKGVPQKLNVHKIILDDEFQQSQTTPGKSQMSSSDEERVHLPPNVQRWFTSEFFYSQMDRVYFSCTDFNSILHEIGLGGVTLGTAEWQIVRKSVWASKHSLH